VKAREGSKRPRGYSLIQIILHWTIAALVIFQLFVNDGMQHAFDDRMDGELVEDGAAALLHITVGVTVLVLAMIRLAVRLIHGAPPAHDDKPAFINWISHATHFVLYTLIFGMPLTGAIAWLGGLELSAEIHELGRLILIPLILLHIAGGLAEHFVFRNDTLVRMLRPKRVV
jgi:cytochrome b561